MNEQPEISIVTVNYNGFSDTATLLRTLQEHLTVSCEIIVVDNGSQIDESHELQQQFPAVRYIRSETNKGFAGGNNQGIRQARGKYIFLLNNDTYIETDPLPHLVETLERHPRAAAVSPKIKFAFPPQAIQFAGYTPLTKVTVRNRLIGFNEPDQGQYDELRQSPYLHGAALLFRKEILETVGEMPEEYFLYYEELDWCNAMRRAGYELWYDPRGTVYHRESRSTGQDSPLRTYYLTRNRLLYARRNLSAPYRFLSLSYQLLAAVPKNYMLRLWQGKYRQAKAIRQGAADFFKCNRKTTHPWKI